MDDDPVPLVDTPGPLKSSYAFRRFTNKVDAVARTVRLNRPPQPRQLSCFGCFPTAITNQLVSRLLCCLLPWLEKVEFVSADQYQTDICTDLVN